MNNNSKKFIKANSFRIALNEFASNASVSGLIWRSPEIAVLSNITLKRPVLDLGCGDGRFTKLMFGEKLEYGLDISSQDIEKAKQRNTHLNYIVGDAHKIDLPKNSVETVFSNSVVEHIPNLEGVLKEISRVLRKNGTLVLTTHAPSSKKFWGSKLLRGLGLQFFAKKYDEFFLKQLQLNTLWEQEKWEKEIKKAGLKIEEFVTTTPTMSAFWYEFFMPLTYFQNRIRFLKTLPLARIIFCFINPDLYPVKGGRNFFIRAQKK